MKKIGIVGAGRLGEALARRLILKEACLIGITCKHFERTEKIAQSLGVTPYRSNYELAQDSEILFVTTPDDVIFSVLEELKRGTLPENLCVVHCSGALSAFDLPSVEGIYRASFHPLQSFSGSEVSFRGLAVAMDGEEYALGVLKELGNLLEVVPLFVPPEDRKLYHSAACMASNYLITLLAVAEAFFLRWTASEKDARNAIYPLVKESIENFKKQGPADALTGPIARGDLQTIVRHLEALDGKPKELYRSLGLATLDLAARSGKITAEQIDQISKVLKREEQEK